MARNEKLIQVKTALADKYDHLARLAGSTPKQKHFKHRADRFRRQVAVLQKGS